jgi:hypothetical protein
MTSRRRFLGAAAGGGVLAATSNSFAAAVNRNPDVAARIVRRDLRTCTKKIFRHRAWWSTLKLSRRT